MPEVAFAVRGLTALEDATAGDVDPDLPEEARRSEVARRLLAAWVIADGRPAFATPDEVGALTEPEFFALWASARAAANIVSPQYRTAHPDEWAATLEAGARHPSNRAIGGVIHYSTEVVVGLGGSAVIAAPDRYFGVPYADLTDGQIMAYQAAKKVFDKLT